ncbi:MAG: hypothetical protein ACE5GX_16410 [Thermoanaerobaculia bacterium]
MKHQSTLGRTKMVVAALMGVLAFTGTSVAQQSRVFVTSSTHDGDLGGLEGADAICQGLGATVDPAATWVAWISTASVDAIDRVLSTGPFVRASDTSTVIADDVPDLTDGSLDAAIMFASLETRRPPAARRLSGRE